MRTRELASALLVLQSDPPAGTRERFRSACRTFTPVDTSQSPAVVLAQFHNTFGFQRLEVREGVLGGRVFLEDVLASFDGSSWWECAGGDAGGGEGSCGLSEAGEDLFSDHL